MISADKRNVRGGFFFRFKYLSMNIDVLTFCDHIGIRAEYWKINCHIPLNREMNGANVPNRHLVSDCFIWMMKWM